MNSATTQPTTVKRGLVHRLVMAARRAVSGGSVAAGVGNSMGNQTGAHISAIGGAMMIDAARHINAESNNGSETDDSESRH